MNLSILTQVPWHLVYLLKHYKQTSARGMTAILGMGIEWEELPVEDFPVDPDTQNYSSIMCIF